MNRFWILPVTLSCTCLVAQQNPMDAAGANLPSKPAPSQTASGKPAPADVDQALRERIAAFYEAQKAGKFRQAEAYVAEDSLDAYFEGRKVRNEGFEILGITYSDDLKKADVVAAVKVRMANPQFTDFVLAPPVHTTWKIDNGRWSWYVLPEQPYSTPYGSFPNKKPEFITAAPPKPVKVDLETVQRGVSVDKGRVMLTKVNPKQEIEITNNLRGGVSLELNVNSVPGFEAKLEKTILGATQKTKLILTRTEGLKDGVGGSSVEIEVIPTNQVIPIQILFGDSQQTAAKK